MAQMDSTCSGTTEELAFELKEKHPDTHRIKWLVDDMGADVTAALVKANLREKDLLKNPILRPLGLQKHLHGRQ